MLGERYDKLARALKDLDAPEVYITDYPGDPFGDHACGLLGLKWYGQTSTIGITDLEAQAMASVGGAFGAAIRRAAERNGWNFVQGMTQGFKGHDYCEDDRWLVQLEESLRRQGNKYGSVHPNRDGHKELAGLLLGSLVLGRPDTPYYQARFTVERVRVGTVAFNIPAPVVVRVMRYQTDVTGMERGITVPKRGEWFDVPAGALSFDLTLRSPPRPPRHATSIRFLVRSSADLPGELTYAQNFGEGVHTFEHPPQVQANKKLAIQYRVTVRRVPPLVRRRR